MFELCECLKGGVIENDITAYRAYCYIDIWTVAWLKHVNIGQHKNIIENAQTHITQYTGFI
jgi:hypothetical protein